ncbi:glycerate kinase [Natranaerobius thermophilus]|uniref:Glycerate 2-kinase n=1 Tax=Natranaerobius thermophilus (strain ATCC BAA-1301 / DSM 18059 / JW/NM-WN-LF) TaxID=457570 RepID=B2A890_NATTJ|nr:glycerate kinase [Natranaerobius thermophilus]ACB84456.1 glycerate 2-kinase [Natranaerobius thermophilus JW/NM-WN-LF]
MEKVILAPDSYKNCLEAKDVATAMERGVHRYNKNLETIKLPLSDGGEGLIKSLVYATDGELYSQKVTGPLGYEVTACWGLLGDNETAVIEMAEAAGLQLVTKENLDPKITTTYGTGELIKDALNTGCSKLIIGIGGSATNDGGVGMAQALGIEFFDDKGKPLKYGGQELLKLSEIDLSGMDPKLHDIDIRVACDVTNPLIGPQGASQIFGPQKGGQSKDIELLDNALSHFHDIIEKELNKDVKDIPGSGAAGGMGAGLIAFMGAELKSGIDLVMEVLNFENQIKDADIVITGEGSFDSQTLFGKVPHGVAKKAKKHKIPTFVVAGNIKEDLQEFHHHGITGYFSIIPGPIDEDQAFDRAEELLENTTHQIIRTFYAGKKR